MTKNQSSILALAERGCIWSGLIMVALFVIGVWPIAGFIPPPDPSASAADIAQRFTDNSTNIIAGSLLVLIAPAFYLLFCSAVSSAMVRHCSNCVFLSRIQFSGATINVVWFSVMGLFWMIAAYRPEQNADSIRLFNDMAWFIMVVPTGAFILQALAVGMVSLTPPDNKTVFPRWLGFFNLWIPLLFIPGMFSAFFKTGPIAWNGLLSFWLEVVVFLMWLVVMVTTLLKSAPSVKIAANQKAI